MSNAAQLISLFRRQIELRRSSLSLTELNRPLLTILNCMLRPFDSSSYTHLPGRFYPETLGILESILLSKDVKLRLDLQSSLKELLRSQTLLAVKEVAEKPIEHKLSVVDFLVRAFSIINDVESCLALRYEALVMRESVSSSNTYLHVSLDEWKAFAENSFYHGFYSITAKVCERALLHLQIASEFKQHSSVEGAKAVEKIQRLRDASMKFSSTHGVQVQADEYLKKKMNLKQPLEREAQYSASLSFRNGIKKRNIRNLKFLRREKEVDGMFSTENPL